MQEKRLKIIAEAGGVTALGGWAAGIGKFVNNNTYPDIEASKKVITTLGFHKLFEVDSSGPFIPTEEFMALVQ